MGPLCKLILKLVFSQDINYSIFLKVSAFVHQTSPLVMLKFSKKKLVSISVAILVPYDTTIQDISDKLMQFFERNVRNILETFTTNFWNILIMILGENVEATSEIGNETFWKHSLQIFEIFW